MNKEQHLSFEKISEQYDLVKDGKQLSEEHLANCELCSKGLKDIALTVDYLVSFNSRIQIKDSDKFVKMTMTKCRNNKIKNLSQHRYFKHGAIAAAAAVVLVIAAPQIRKSPKVAPTIAENKAANAVSDNAIALKADSIEQVVYFLKKNNIAIIAVEKNKVRVRSTYRSFLNLKNAAESSLDNHVNFINSSNLNLAGTAAGQDMYIPGGDRVVSYDIFMQ